MTKPVWNTRRARRGWAWALGVAVLAALGGSMWWMLRAQRQRAAAPSPAATAPRAVSPDDGSPDAAAPKPGTDDVRAPAAAAAKPAGVTDGFVVNGTVANADGGPAVGAQVSIHRAVSAWPEWNHTPLEGPVSTDENGRFSIRAPDRHGLLVEFAHADQAGGLQQVSFDAAFVRLSLQPGHELAGVVQDPRGNAVAKATVSLESVASEQRRSVVVETGANGGYRFTNLAAGPVRVVVRHDAWMPVTLPVLVIGDVPRRNDVQRRTIAFQQPATKPIRGRVVSAVSQQPVANAAVELWATGTRPGLSTSVVERTDADGAFEFSGLPAGSVRVLVRHPEHGALQRNLTVGPATAELTWEMPGRSLVRGRVVGDARGSGGGDEALEIRDSAGQLAFTTIARDGTFQFRESLSPGTATLTVVSGAFAFERTRARDTTATVEEATTTELSLPIVAPSVIRGRVVDDDGRPLAGAAIWRTRAFKENARLLGSALTQFDIGSAGSRVFQLFGGERDELVAVSGPDGTFEARGQKPGPVTMRVAMPGRGSRWQSFELAADAGPHALAEAILRPGCRISGRVVGGRGVVGATVLVNGDAQATTITQTDGKFVVDDLPPGDYVVRARSPSSPNSTKDVRVVAAVGQPARDIELRLETGRVVSGVITNLGKQRVPNAVVTVVGTGQSTLSDENGEFLVEPPAGPVKLEVSLADRSRAPTIVPVAADQTSVPVVLEIPPTATLTARIAGVFGRKRVNGVLLRLGRLDDPANTAVRSTWVELQDGELAWPSCPVGRVRVEIWSKDFAPFVTESTFVANEVTALGAVRLEPGARLHGQVRDPAGQPVANADVWLGEPGDVDQPEMHTRTAADGTFAVTGVGRHSSRVVVRAAGFEPNQRDLDLPKDVLAVEPLSITLGRAR